MAMTRQASPPFDGSPSPQPQPLTKRDVRRNRIMEKLQGIVDSFASNQHQHYRAQLQAVQVDMTMVLRADPYGTAGPLDDDHDDVRSLVEQTMRGDANGSGGIALPNDEAARNQFWSMAGKRYSEFVREVNNAVEERDADLTALHNNHASSLAELDRLYQQRLHQAEEEHKALSGTIRQRLITTLNKKRQGLLRDKEQIDIADSNAMLLHPNHFSIGINPASPGPGNGVAINKRTRHLRHHRGASPVPGGAEGDNGKRKRKFGQLDEDLVGNESPLPSYAGGRSPLKDARNQREYTQFEAPAYSLDRLFTEKELAMATDTARIATYKYFHQPQQAPEGSGSNGTMAPSVNGEIAESADGAIDQIMTDANGANTPPPDQPAAVEMERTTSHQVLTRGGAKANPLAALSDLANAAAAASTSVPVIRENPFAPVAPPFHAVTRSEKSGAPPPQVVNNLDIENDFEMMRRAGADNPGEGNVEMNPAAVEEAKELRRQLLDQALGEPGVRAPYRLPPLETGPGALLGRGVDREPRTGFAPVLPIPSVAESRIRAANLAASGGGSLAAALSGRLGGEPMSRTTSAGGLSELGEALPPRRGRGVPRI